jgi:hypothetical protein
MDAADVLIRLHESGLTALAESGNLIVRPKAALTDETRALIRAHKAELLTALAQGTSWRWRITQPDGTLFEIYELPEPTQAMVERSFPGAAVTPIPDNATLSP